MSGMRGWEADLRGRGYDYAGSITNIQIIANHDLCKEGNNRRAWTCHRSPPVGQDHGWGKGGSRGRGQRHTCSWFTYSRKQHNTVKQLHSSKKWVNKYKKINFLPYLSVCVCVCVCVCVRVTQSCPTLCEPMDCCSPPDPSVHGILQARILELVAIKSL